MTLLVSPAAAPPADAAEAAAPAAADAKAAPAAPDKLPVLLADRTEPPVSVREGASNVEATRMPL